VCVDVNGTTVLTTIYRDNTHVTRPQILVPDSEKTSSATFIPLMTLRNTAVVYYDKRNTPAMTLIS
jgi:hypothetical protein